MIDPRKTEEIAVQKMQLLSPLLEEGLNEGKARQLKAQICKRSDFTDRTLRRYLSSYKETGFSGLKPRERGQRKSKDAIPLEILEQARLIKSIASSKSLADK